MFQVFPSSNKLERLQDLALPHVIDKVLRDASKLSLRLGIDVYVYNFPGYRKIKKSSSIDFVDERIEFFITKDNRIVIKGAECLSAVFLADRAARTFKRFQQIGLTISKDISGIYYFEKELLPYNVIKGNMETFGDTSKWRTKDWLIYFNLWKGKCSSFWDFPRYQSFHFLHVS